MNTSKFFLLETKYDAKVWIINDKSNFWVVLHNFGNGKTLPESNRDAYNNEESRFTVDYVNS